MTDTQSSADAITALYLTADGQREAPPRMGKLDFARWLVARLVRR